MNKGTLMGIAKTSIVLLSLFILVFFSIFYILPALAAHTFVGAVITATTGATNVDTLQTVGLNFSVNKTSGLNNITNISIDFGGTGWSLPQNNNSVRCTSPNGAWRSDVTGNVVSCLPATVTNYSTNDTVFNITISTNITANTPRSPASAQTSTFRINTTDDISNTNTTTVNITVTQLNATANVTPTTSVASGRQAYTFDIKNVGTDPIDRIIINYSTAAFVDTEAANVTCPTISTAWTATVNTTADTITCTKDTSNLAANSNATIVVSSWAANDTGGLKNFYVDVRGTLLGNFTIVQGVPNVTVYGTASTTFVNNVTANQSINTNGVMVASLNISATGEGINVTAVNITLSGNGTNFDVSNVFLQEAGAVLAGASGNFSGSPLAVNLSLTTPLGITAGNAKSVNIMFNISALANAGDTVGANITVNGSITLIGNSSALGIVTGGTPTGVSTNILIFGNVTIVASNAVVANVTPSQAEFLAANATIRAGGEQIESISINITTNADRSTDLSQILIFRDSSCDGSVSGDTLVANRSTAFATNVSVSYNLTGQTIARGSTNCYAVAFNISSTAAGNNKFNVTIGAAAANAVGNASRINLVSTGSTALGSSTNFTVFGNLSITGINANPTTTVIGTRNLSVIRYNFSSTGEIISVHEINITRLGSAVDADIANVTLYNGTSTDNVFNGDETYIANLSASTSGVYNFNLNNATSNWTALQVPSGGNSVVFVVFDVAGGATGGRTFGANLTAQTTIGNTSTIRITPAITNRNSSTSLIFGNLSVSGADLTPSVANNNQSNVQIVNLTFTATGEGMNITLLNITMNNTNNNDVTSIKLYNGSSAGTLISTATKSGSVAAFGTAGTTLYVVPGGGSAGLVVAFDINASATGGNRVDAYLNATSDVAVTGIASNLSITIVGTPANPAGNTVINTLSGKANVTPTSAAIGNATNYTFTIENSESGSSADSIDRIVINYTAANYTDTETNNITCPTIVNLWSRSVDTTLNTITCTAPSSTEWLTPGTNAQLNITNFVAPTTAGVKQFDVRVRGANGQGTFDITTNKPSVTVGGTITITGTNANPTNTVIGTTNVTAIAYLFNASGEAMNISQINITRTGTATTSDIVNIRLIQDSNVNNVFDSADTNTIATQATNSTPDIYNFSNLNLQIVSNMTILVVFNISSSATGTRTFGVNIAAANITTIGNASGGSITETVTTPNSSTSRILGNLSMAVTDLAPANISAGQGRTAFLRLNFTATGETFNITEINITKLGTLPAANTTVEIFNDAGSTANSLDATDASLGSNNTGGNRTAVSVQAVSGTPLILYVAYNISASQSGDLTVGAQIIGSNVTALTNTSSISVTPTGAATASTVSNVQVQANLALGTLSATSVWITNQAEFGNLSLILTIPLTNNGNATATAVNVSRTITLLNFTNNTATANFTVTQTDTVLTIRGNGTQVNLTYNISVNAGAAHEGIVHVNVSIAYNDSNTAVVSTNSPVAGYTSTLFRVDNTDPVITRSALDTPGNNSAVNGTVAVNVTVTDATSGLNGSSSTVRMIVANGTTTLVFNMTNLTTALTTWNSTLVSTNFADGPYNITFNATDVAGNNILATNVLRITIDNTVPAFSGEIVNDTTINPLQFTDFSINVTERTFNASNVFISVINFTNITVRTITPTCTGQASLVLRCNITWDGTNDTGANVSATTYRFKINVTDNATQFATTNSTNIVTVSTDTTPPTVTPPWSPNNAAFPTNTVTIANPALDVNTSEAATCKFDRSTDNAYASMAYTMTGTGTTHNFTLSLIPLLDGAHNIYVRCVDPVGNAMTTGQLISFTLDTRNLFNITLPNVLGQYFLSNNWNGFELPLFRLQNTSVANTNVTTVLASLTGNFSNFYGYDGTNWKSFQPGAAVNSFTNFTYNAAGTSYYIYINVTNERLEIP